MKKTSVKKPKIDKAAIAAMMAAQAAPPPMPMPPPPPPAPEMPPPPPPPPGGPQGGPPPAGPGMKKGGKVKKMFAGGLPSLPTPTAAAPMARRGKEVRMARGGGCEVRGKTKGRFI